MEIKTGYKKTEVGVIPNDWNLIKLKNIVKENKIPSGVYKPKSCYGQGIKIIKLSDVFASDYFSNDVAQEIELRREEIANYNVKTGDIIIALASVKLDGVGKVMLVNNLKEVTVFDHNVGLIRLIKDVNPRYVFYLFKSKFLRKLVALKATHVGTTFLKTSAILEFILPVSPFKLEQKAIAEALSDADALIESLEKLIAKKRQIKQGAMQELLDPKKNWVKKSIIEIANCLDNLRIPLNDSQRSKMKGDYPYCGANGIIDYINSYCIDDSVILIAEDGGYFDEYMYRPIAYKMSGKFWINNHVHILKSKEDFDQDFLFYSLVHKNILSFLTSGTRAKLNRFELNKIRLSLPKDKKEQENISTILSEIDSEILFLEKKLYKAHQIKQGMMHNLLTGRIRLL